MEKNEFRKLHTGDIIKSKFDGAVYIVLGNYGDHVTAVKSVDMTNPDEWELLEKAKYN